jgi:hypothetical protein
MSVTGLMVGVWEGGKPLGHKEKLLRVFRPLVIRCSGMVESRSLFPVDTSRR